MLNNTITWEQAIQLDKRQEIGEYYKEQLQQIARFFGKNTIFQMTHSEIFFESFELITPLVEKDYSKFLFEKCDSLIVKFNNLKDDPASSRLVKSAQEAAKLRTELLLKSLKNETDKDNTDSGQL